MNNENLIHELNLYLADLNVMYTKLHNLHWYVSGPHFFTLHEKYEEFYTTFAEAIDVVAERILSIGGKPTASLQTFLNDARIKELPAADIDGVASVQKIVEDFTFLEAQTKVIIQLADTVEDAPTGDLFTEFAEWYQKTLWMLHAFQK